MFKTIIEPFKIKVIEPIRMTTPEERRAYTQSHIDYVIEVAGHVYRLREALRGFRAVKQAPMLRHFTIEFEPV